jgi:hypothetical protein
MENGLNGYLRTQINRIARELPDYYFTDSTEPGARRTALREKKASEKARSLVFERAVF